jgi:hypothetical protein
MSRSYRRPFAAITGLASAKWDKQLAHRGVRRKQNLAQNLHRLRRICFSRIASNVHWNDTYNWGRDGAQCYHSCPPDSEDEYYRNYYRKLLRK